MKVLIKDWIPRFQYYMRMKNSSERTIKNYSRWIAELASFSLTRVKKEASKISWEDISKEQTQGKIPTDQGMILDFLTYLSTVRKYQAASTAACISALKTFYRFLQAQNAIEENPMTQIEKPRIKKQDLVYLKHDQVMSFLGTIQDPQHYLILRLLYATGLRVSEIHDVKIEDFDLTARSIKILGKGEKYRTVFVDEETIQLIKNHVKERIKGPLFLGQLGKPFSVRGIQILCHRYAPIGITPHKLRHSHASELYKNCRDLNVVRESLGHSSLSTTSIYLHTDLEDRKAAYDKSFPLSKTFKEAML